MQLFLVSGPTELSKETYNFIIISLQLLLGHVKISGCTYRERSSSVVGFEPHWRHCVVSLSKTH